MNTDILNQFNTTEMLLTEHLDKDIREIFFTMVGVEIAPAQTAATLTSFNDCVTGMVGLAGSYNGMLIITTPQKLAMTFTSQMLGMEVTECDKDVHDALGEIANMIAGSFKHHFVTNGHEAQLSTPSVISGERYVMTIGSPADSLTLMFRSGDENFLVSVYVESAT